MRAKFKDEVMQRNSEVRTRQGLWRSFYKPITRTQLLVNFYQLECLLRANVSLAEALEDVATGERKMVAARCWKTIANDVRAGCSFSQALATTDTGLDHTALALIRTGEANGHLDQACASVYHYLKWHSATRGRIATALVYPLFSLAVSLAVIGFLFISVVPSIEGFLMSSNAEMSWHTRLLIGASAWVRQQYQGVLVILSFLVICVALSIRFSSQVRLLLDIVVLQLPLLGKVVLDLSLSRYTQCIAQLYGAGITLESAAKISEQAVSNQYIRSQLTQARVRMISGDSFAHALGLQSVFPALFVRMIGVGELSGQLVNVFSQIAEQQQVDSETTLTRVEQMMGPTLLLMVGSVLLWIVVSALGPVYNIAIGTAIGLT